MLARILLALTTFLSCFPICYADDLESDIPPQLQPWISWVTAAHPEWNCAQRGGKPVCDWPGVIQYEVEGTRALFTIRGTLLKDGALPVPSTSSVNPKGLTITQEPGKSFAPILIKSDGQLELRLPAGSYRITGYLEFDTPPRELPIPPSYGIFNATGGTAQDVDNQVRTGDKIILGDPDKQPSTNVDSVQVSIFRRLIDRSPLDITTVIKLRVSGDARPLNLGRVLPGKSVPYTASSALPFFLSKDGDLAVQLTPGTHHVTIESYLQLPVEAIELPKPGTIWPESELWSYVTDYSFRTATIGGGQAVHAGATDLPEDWKSGATYSVPAGGALTITENSRGQTKTEQNSWSLAKQIFVDMDG